MIARFAFLYGLLLWLVAANVLAETTIRVGVLAYRGTGEELSNWENLPAQLAAAIPGHTFEVRSLAGPALREAVQIGRASCRERV